MNDLDEGDPPKSVWAKLVPELIVRDLTESCLFWQNLLDFRLRR